MSELRFSSDHEWIRRESDGTAYVGITEYAQDQLGEIVFVELPEVGAELDQGDDVTVIESVKAAGELKAPVGGTVLAVNEALRDEPELVNNDPTGDGWIMHLRLSDTEELETLMDAEAYQEYVDSLE